MPAISRRVSLPLFDRTLSTSKDLARSQLHREQRQLEQVQIQNSRSVFFNRLGEIRDRSFEQQR
jgi:TnpA family transposase